MTHRRPEDLPPVSGDPPRTLTPEQLSRIHEVGLRFDRDCRAALADGRDLPEPEAYVADDYPLRYPLLAQLRFIREELAPPHAAAPTSGQPAVTVAGYEVLGELGRGGMGVVYKARQVGLDRVVALKMIHTQGEPTAQQRERFRLEAEAIARLKHPHIVPVHAWGEEGGRPYFAMEYVEGGSLAERLKDGPLPPRLAAELVQQVARGVHAAHAAGIVHRDLKPANVLLVGAVGTFSKGRRKDGVRADKRRVSRWNTRKHYQPHPPRLTHVHRTAT